MSYILNKKLYTFNDCIEFIKKLNKNNKKNINIDITYIVDFLLNFKF